MKKNIRLSLILPAYNVSDYIEACVESCQQQNISKEEYEIIIVNDGSTDSTPDIINRLANKWDNIKIVNQENQGLSMARNNGFDAATGKYIWFIDSDDKITTDCLSELLSIAEVNNLDALVVGPSIPFVDKFPTDFNTSNDINYNFRDGIDYVCNKQWFVVGAWCYLINHDFWAKNKLRFYPGIYFEDSQLMPYAISKANRVASLCRFSCYNYIVRDGSIMNSSITEKKLLSHVVIVNTYLEYAKKADSDQLRELFEIIASTTFISAMNGIAKFSNKKQLSKQILSAIPVKPHKIYGKGIVQKLFHKFVLTFPRLFIKLKSCFNLLLRKKLA